jgi:hypothetical protein
MAVLKYYNTTTSAWEYIAASTTANFTTWKKTMAGGETSVSGTDDNAVTLSYTVGLEQVFINGVLQVRGSDYTATTGTTVTGLTALAVNDIVSVVCYAPFNVTNTYTKSETDGVAAAAPGMRMIVPTSVAVGSGTGSANANGYVTFSGASSISLNGVFTAAYDNYRVIFTTTSNTASGYINMRLRSVTDITAANYFSSVVQAAYGSTAIGNDNGGNSQTTWNRFGYYDGTTDAYASSGDILLPFVSAFTSFNAAKARSGYGSEFATGVYKATTSVDGFTIYSAGNFTGNVAVYGYKD